MTRSMTVRADELLAGDHAALAGVVVKIRQPRPSTTGRTLEVTWPPQGMVESGRVTLLPSDVVVIERGA
jgi:hypothetical protein